MPHPFDLTTEQEAAFTAWYNAEYARMGAEGRFKGLTIRQFEWRIRSSFNTHNVTSYIDYGCGQAMPYELSKFLSQFSPVLYDPYVERFSAYPQPADAVVCVDVLEHLPRYLISSLLRDVFSLAKKLVILTYCPRAARKTFSDGTNLHLTIENEAFWRARIDEVNLESLPFHLMGSI
ncbi:MAG: hypothetical protein ACREXR_00590 [Gammaproteobacteria bacterium]